MGFLHIIAAAGFAVCISGGVTAAADVPPTPTRDPSPASPGTITFSSHIARIVHQHCAGCHHPGQAAPFDLLTYKDVSRRASQILEVVDRHIMPPWLPAHGYGDFSNERRLTETEVSLLRRWVESGAPEGDPRQTPAPPEWPSGWSLGTPDLIVTMAKPFPLGAEGPDVYRNFVIPLPLDRDRLVRAVEFHPGNPRIVHHAFIRVDEEGLARKLENPAGAPGFDNMLTTARMPGGQFLAWNPGSGPVIAPPGLAWTLPKRSDLVVEMHLNRTGKPETLQSSVGFYFTEDPPTNACQVFKLGSYALDFPAGASNVIVRDSMVLPVDVDVLAVYPHAHFLCRDMQGYARLPDGTTNWLVWIKQWDFNWQGEYRYRQPVRLPQGTTLHLRYAYDNSTNNLANPFYPPRRIRYGEQSSDEMCELGLQVLTHRTNDTPVLAETVARHRDDLIHAMLQQRVDRDPADAQALTQLGMSLWLRNRPAEAWECLNRAVQAAPHLAEAHHNRGVFLRFNNQPAAARVEFEAALRLNPQFPKTHQQLGFALASLGLLAEAERSFLQALELDPGDADSQSALRELRQVTQSRPPSP